MMKKIASLLSATAFLVILCGGSALFAQHLTQDRQDVTFQVNLFPWYDLSIDHTIITFTDLPPGVSNPPLNVSIGANENAVNVIVFAIMNLSKELRLTVTANGNLIDGSKTIGIGAISWTKSGAGYEGGTLNLAPVIAGSWTSSIVPWHYHEGTFSYFFLRNYQTQEPGNYQATATYILSSF